MSTVFQQTQEQLEQSIKVAWGHVALWKHRYLREKEKREALEDKIGKTQSQVSTFLFAKKGLLAKAPISL